MENLSVGIFQSVEMEPAYFKGIKKAPSKNLGPDGGDEWIAECNGRVVGELIK